MKMQILISRLSREWSTEQDCDLSDYSIPIKVSLNRTIDERIKGNRVCIKSIYKSAMYSKSLGTLAMIYTINQLQNPLPRYTMLSEANTNSRKGTSDV